MRPSRLLIACAAALAAVCCGSSAATAVPAAGVIDGNGNVLIAFDTGAPALATTTRSVTGLRPGEQLEAIDYRFQPRAADGTAGERLYGLGIVHGASDSAQLYRIDVGTGVATRVGNPIPGLQASSAWDIDVDPAIDQIRVVNAADLNMRIDPDTGDARLDADVNPAGSQVGAVAYEADVARGTTESTLWALTLGDRIGLIGGGDGAPSANGGSLSTNGGYFGVATTPGSRLGFDYTPPDAAANGTPTGFATLSTAPDSGELYRIQTVPYVGPSLAFVGDLPAPLRAFALLPVTIPVPARLTLSGLPRRLTLAQLLHRGVKVTVAPSAPVRSLQASLLGTAQRATIARVGDLVLASRSYPTLSSAKRTIALRPPRRLIGRPTRAFGLSVAVTAIAADGRRVTASASLRVTVPRRR